MELHAIMLSIVGLVSVTSICHHLGETHQSDGYDMFASDVVRKYLFLENRRNPPDQMKLDSIEFGKIVIFNMEYGTVHSNIEGYGTDNVGEFILNEIFSKETNRIDIVQSYKYGTGNPYLNAGHQCQFRVTWNKEKRLFGGVMYVPNGWMMVPEGLFDMSFVHAA